MKLIVFFLACLALPADAMSEELSVRFSSVILSHDDLQRTQVGKLRFRGGLDLRSRDSRFGGLSGLAISADGARLTAVGDRGVWFTALLEFDKAGWLTGLSNARLRPVIRPDGKSLQGRSLTDSESIAPLTDGTLVVGFEQRHRLRRFAGPGAAANFFGAPAALRASPPNGGAEAVTRLWGNQLLVLSERREARPGVAAGWIGPGQEWRAVGFRKSGIFRPVGAATRDDGTVFILERRFTTIGGIASRISYLPAKNIASGIVFEGQALAELSAPLVADNFEGIAVRPGKLGKTLIYIVSDDNFHDL